MDNRIWCIIGRREEEEPHFKVKVNPFLHDAITRRAIWVKQQFTEASLQVMNAKKCQHVATVPRKAKFHNALSSAIFVDNQWCKCLPQTRGERILPSDYGES